MDVESRCGVAGCIYAPYFLMSQAVRRVVGTGHFTISFRKDIEFNQEAYFKGLQ